MHFLLCDCNGKTMKNLKLYVSFTIIIRCCYSSDENGLYVGAVFDTVNENNELMFQIGVDIINTKYEHNLQILSGHSLPNEPFGTTQRVCTLLEDRIVGIFGPANEANANAVRAVCDVKEIPLMETRWDFHHIGKQALVNVHPDPATIVAAYVDFVNECGWNDFTILYEHKDSLLKLGGLLGMRNSSGPTIVVRQLDKNNTGNYRPMLKEVLWSGETHFILDCALENVDEILRQAQQIGLITDRYHFFILNLDLQTLDLTSYQYAGANITGLSLIDPDNDMVLNAYKLLQNLRIERGLEAETSDDLNVKRLHSETALMLDAIELFGQAFNDLKLIKDFIVEVVSCNGSSSADFGYTLINYMKLISQNGLTGKIVFDNEGLRTDFSLNIVQLQEEGLTKIGMWNSFTGIQINKISVDENIPEETSLRNRTFRVLIALTAPYAMLRQSTTKLSENDQYEGFGIDLINELSLMEGFKYVFSIRADKANGAKLPNGTWTGMIGDIIANKVDLALADLTITAEREEAVEFTSPFMSLGISILYRKPEKAPPSFFSFAAPFAFEVWLLLAAATFGVSISLYIMGRMCPAEWSNPYPCVENPKYLVNQFSVPNSFWFAIGSLMQQGSEIAPVGISTRMVAGVWWFFTLIMVSSYTANLAASLTSEFPEQHFSNIKELAEKAEKIGIKYGAKVGGSTAAFFMQGAKNKTEYKIIYDHMQSHKSEMVDDNTVGVLRADEGKYAFFMESTSIEYEIQRHCNLTQVGSKLDDKGYGIAMRKNSGYRHPLSTALLKLQSAGVIDQLKRKWWEEKGGQCNVEEPEEGAPPLDFKNVSGIFWVTLGGSAFALIIVIFESLIHTFKQATSYKTSFREECKKEVEFYFQFKEFVKPVESKQSSSEENLEENKDCTPMYGFKSEILQESTLQL